MATLSPSDEVEEISMTGIDLCNLIANKEEVKMICDELEKVPTHKEKPVIRHSLYDIDNKQIKFKLPFWKRIFRR